MMNYCRFWLQNTSCATTASWCVIFFYKVSAVLQSLIAHTYSYYRNKLQVNKSNEAKHAQKVIFKKSNNYKTILVCIMLLLHDKHDVFFPLHKMSSFGEVESGLRTTQSFFLYHFFNPSPFSVPFHFSWPPLTVQLSTQ